ncbi:DUF3558 domain-containing protein [Actinophytocola xanthii]|uniref:DUF3558 domain-containing protein n=1 Tax=Actinophytocola xanthii TaxID=1912961 RepID=A0A1Q8CU44_9PSEU|nr:DUF3558 domain-containing protein [Actinophytocola xanthii]OLF17882.1 hypothetical protein BU204_08705 [Actinophytocola xanthii]
MRFWGWWGVVLVGVLATGCSGSESPDDGAGDDNRATAGATATAEWSTPDGTAPSSSASRHEELTVDRARPCDLLTEDQLGELGLTGEQTSDLSSTWSTDTCRTWDADKTLSASVTAVSTEGVDAFYRGRFANMRYRPTEVAGLPALFYRFDGVEHACYLAIDVADGQLLDVAFGANAPESTDASLDELCDTARRVGEAAVRTLRAAG